ncbi:peptide-methionine (S)-S-oxide reductase [Parvularcula dongshanensis]|uniref:peptide-methionine (S)-S-oxide reductase n=1 Tax=Parvularcula dongshanensis TaxID=1173995 RepID=A0A840I0N2_9PROT|nr:peptide-methionine (S)-S-oxide reductase [Parvularcula dongshanensis]
MIGFGGGCHWCTEAVFSHLRGVGRVEQGWIASVAPDDDFSEAVRVTFSPGAIPLAVLIDVHLRTHSSGSDHSMRGKYRSAVYAPDEGTERLAEAALAQAQMEMRSAVVTRVLPLTAFRPSGDRYQRYYERRPDAPFCRTYIDPKLAKMRRRYGVRVLG